MVKGEKSSVYLNLQNKYNKLTNQLLLNQVVHLREQLSKATWILECEETCIQGTAFMLEGVGLITCFHVLGTKTKAFNIKNITRKYDVTLVRQDKDKDIAILKLENYCEEIYSLNHVHDGDLLRTGTNLLSIGYPNYNIGNSLYQTEGTIAGERVAFGVKRFATTCQLIQGMSGGPVLSLNNLTVLGVIVTGAKDDQNAERLENNFIPISHVLNLFSE
jgi:S1-C subfamily serine protease